MEERGDGSHNDGNGQQFHPQFIPSGDYLPVHHLQGGILAWLGYVVDLGILDGGFGVELHMLQHQHAADNPDNIGNNNVEDNVDNDENIGNNNVGNVGMEDNQDIPEEDPLPGGSRRRSREEDEETEERSRKRFRWWDEFADSDSDSDSDSTDEDYVEYAGINPVQDAGADMEVNQHVGEEDPLPDGSKKRSREDDEEEDERRGQKYRRLDEDLFEDAMEDNQPVEEEAPVPGGSRKRSREEDTEEDGRAGKQFRR